MARRIKSKLVMELRAKGMAYPSGMPDGILRRNPYKMQFELGSLGVRLQDVTKGCRFSGLQDL